VELRESERTVEDGASKELQKIRLVISKRLKETIKVSCKSLALGYHFDVTQWKSYSSLYDNWVLSAR
jgi:flagellar motor protein MotB